MRTLRTGLIIAAVLGVADIAAAIAGGGDTPPLPVAIAAAALGLITLVAAGYGRRGRRAAVITVIVTRVLSALGAVPAFFADDVPAAFVASAAVLVALTIAVVALLIPPLRRQAVA
ncbi:hypothetical protein OHA72_06355 [Dactylosporangium sp. NBC_01737]|uniref:hypothetical protein n=1 Tax=Dactylosporangium sp. NBC_01737 TaxID=2975959 RepID=UPI002E117633|nr:hypothetical protein OHA72_06355 [Dactylosporangium sp. NBC_01737]